MSIVAVTGVNGFAGYHVARALHESGHQVLGIGREGFLSQNLGEFVSSYQVCDLSNEKAVESLDLKGISSIINLAGFAKVGVGEEERKLYLQVNTAVHTNMAELLHNKYPAIRMISISSGAVYRSDQKMPLTEDSSLQDQISANVYVASKLAMEEALLPYQDAGLDIIVVRPFNHTGPGQLPGFLIPDLGEQLKNALLNSTSIKTGNLQTRRDYTDVRDVARAYVSLALANRKSLTHKIYNVCSGRSIAGVEILDMLKGFFDAPNIATETDPTRIRTQDTLDIYGSYERLKSDTGWKPTISIEQTLKDFVDWCKTT